MFLSIGVKDYDLDKTLTCGQIFRYTKLDDNTYQVLSGDRRVWASYKDGIFTLQTLFARKDEEKYWRRFFNLSFNSDALYSKVKGNTFLEEVYEYNRGLHILRQDPWECLISFIISQQKKIPQIQKSIEALCERAGVRTPGSHPYYTFPTAYSLLFYSLEDLKLGYRLPYILSAAEYVNRGLLNLSSLTPDKVTFGEAFVALNQVYGVGPKVANCVLLFGLGFWEAFPVDTHISKILEVKELQGFNPRLYGEDAGILQQYLFNYAINNGF